MAAKVITLVDWGETLRAECDLTSFDSDGFTLNWTTNDTSAFILNYIALGGGDLTNAKVVQWENPTITGDKTVTGVGFKPECVLHAYAMSAIPASGAEARFTFGAMDKHGNQWTNSFAALDAAATSNTGRGQFTTYALADVDYDQATNFSAAFKSMNSDGFTLAYDNADGAASRYVISLCLRGGAYKVGNFVGAASAVSQSIGGVGFAPKGILTSNNGDSAGVGAGASATWALGAASKIEGTEGVAATGGTVTYNASKKIHTFTSSGSFIVTQPGEVEYLVVAGGGGGGYGGGGAGGMRTGTLTVTPGTYSITVGAGGVGYFADGANSVFSTITSIGGGGGGNSTGDTNGRPGGSGGGGYGSSPGLPGAGTAGQGNNGGTPQASASRGSGGGGAGAVGGSATTGGLAGAGGNGLQSSITGTATYYAGGGAGYDASASNPGGGFGGGGGQGQAGVPNTGGGGGAPGNNGGSGIVIIAYKTVAQKGIALRDQDGQATTSAQGYQNDYIVNNLSPSSASTVNWQAELSSFDSNGFTLNWSIAATAQVMYLAFGDSVTDAVATNTLSFGYTGAEQTWIVPPGVTSVVIEAWGASGGVGARWLSGERGAGGQGGYSKGTLSTTPGETLRVYVGGKGGDVANNTAWTAPGTAGFNGGAAGGGSTGVIYAGGGSGGASDVRQGGSALANRVIVAGGGGGGGGWANSEDAGNGGYGGGSTGQAGGAVVAFQNPAGGGGGGTQAAGGSAGTAGGVNGNAGTAGSLASGGRGGDGRLVSGGYASGGGGGGGYYGGGGGGGGGDTGGYSGAGGGGGSNYVGGVTSTTSSQGGWIGDGFITITYTVTNTPISTTFVKVGSFQGNGANGIQQIVGIGFRPKAVIVYGEGATSGSPTGFRSAYYLFLGFSTGGGKSYAISASSATGVTPSNTSRRMSASIISAVEYGEAMVYEAKLESFDADGLTINWTTGATTHHFNYIAVGGIDLTDANVALWNAGLGNKSITGVGFRPDLVIHMGTLQNSLASASWAEFGWGAMDKNGNQWTNSFDSQDNVNPSNTTRYQRTDKCYAIAYAPETVYHQASFVSMDADGFTVNFDVATGGQLVASLCLKGPRFKVGSFTSPAGTGNQSIANVGFQPRGLLTSNIRHTADTFPQANALWGLGAVSGVGSEKAIKISDADAQSVTATDGYQNDYMLAAGIWSNNLAQASDLVSFDSGGFTHNWNTNSYGAGIQYLYLAIGDAATSFIGWGIPV